MCTCGLDLRPRPPARDRPRTIVDHLGITVDDLDRSSALFDVLRAADLSRARRAWRWLLADVDRLWSAAPAHGWARLYEDRWPWAGGPGHYAAFLEDAERFKVELVAGDGS